MRRIDERARRSLETADRIHALLKTHGIDAALIGAVACAFHGYSRATEDIDLAVYADPVQKLPEVVRALATLGFEVEFVRPDAEDPLGGVISIRGEELDLIQIVNFCNPLSGADNPGWQSIEQARPVGGGHSLRVVDLPGLIALKLYAGGVKNRLDVIELLERNAPLDLESIRVTCRKFDLDRELDSLLRELGLE